jgi:hypothetical protein
MNERRGALTLILTVGALGFGISTGPPPPAVALRGAIIRPTGRPDVSGPREGRDISIPVLHRALICTGRRRPDGRPDAQAHPSGSSGAAPPSENALGFSRRC